MIPKIIHYIWFGGKELPKPVKKCIKSWQKYCPGYEIKRWDESNFDFSSNRYATEAFEMGKWAFVSDYARLKVVCDEGGIYFDTDVELIKPIDDIVEKYDAFFGYEDDKCVATGLGFGATKGNKFVDAMLKQYDDIPFKMEDGSFDKLPCPKRNTQALEQLGLDITQKGQEIDGAVFFAKEIMCPMDYYTGKKHITPQTISIHHYDASWTSAVSKRTTRLKRLIGVKNYDRIYGKFLHKSKRWEW